MMRDNLNPARSAASNSVPQAIPPLSTASYPQIAWPVTPPFDTSGNWESKRVNNLNQKLAGVLKNRVSGKGLIQST